MTNLSRFINDTIEDKSVVSNDFSTGLGAIILGLVFLLGVPGNLFIVWSILARIRRRSVTTLLILNLACADGLLMALTIFFIIYLAKQSWIFGDAMCKCLFYLCNANMYASIFLITLMSVHRMVVVLFPRRLSHRITRKVVIRVIVGMWVFVMLIALPSLVFRDVREDQDEQKRTRSVCAPNHTTPREVSIVGLTSTINQIIVIADLMNQFIFSVTRKQKKHHSWLDCCKALSPTVKPNKCYLFLFFC